MHTPNDLRTAVATIFENDLNVAVPTPDTDLLESGLLNSVSFVELVMAIEERFAVRVPLDDLELDHFRTLDQIAAFVARLAPVAGDVEAA